MINNKFLFIFVFFIVIILIFSGCKRTVDVKTMQTLIETEWESNGDYDENSFIKNLDDASSFTVTDIDETDKNCYTVYLDVTSPDILDELKTYQAGIEISPSEEKINSQIKEFINNAQPKTTQQTLTVFKTEEGFSVVFNEEFIDAMCGYSYTYCMDEMQKVLGEIE